MSRGVIVAVLLLVVALAAKPATAQDATDPCPEGFEWKRLSGTGCVQIRDLLPPHGKITYDGTSGCEDGYNAIFDPRESKEPVLGPTTRTFPYLCLCDPIDPSASGDPEPGDDVRANCPQLDALVLESRYIRSLPPPPWAASDDATDGSTVDQGTESGSDSTEEDGVGSEEAASGTEGSDSVDSNAPSGEEQAVGVAESSDGGGVDPEAQAAAAAATALLAGGWLWLERSRQRGDNIPSSFTSEEEEDRYWDARNRAERAAALRDHQRFADDQWAKFTDRCRQRAAEDRAAADAERRDRQLQRLKADRLEDMATKRGYRDLLDFLQRRVVKGDGLPSWAELEAVRNAIVRRTGDQAAIDRYFEKSDVRVFLEGCHDTLARGVGRAVGYAHGSLAGRLAEAMVRDPEIPVRIGVAALTGGVSELVLLPVDAWRAMEEAADRKMAEQNLELSDWDATKAVIKTGLWHIGGEVAGDLVGKAVAGRAAGKKAVAESSEAAARRAAGQTGDDFVRRVNARLAAKRAAREAGEEVSDAAARRVAGAVEQGTSPTTMPRDGWVRHYARPGEVIPANHLHETGITVRDARAAGRICADEGVEIGARTTNIDSMRHIRDGTALPKPVDVKAKTINQADVYLGADEADKGLVGLFKPTEPDMSKIPRELQDAVTKRKAVRLREFTMAQDEGFLRLLKERGLEIRGNKIIDVATGKPFAGDIDAVFVKDKATGKYLTDGPRYDRVMQRFQTDVGGQHGSEMAVVRDITAPHRPGTPQHQAALDEAVALRGKLQAAHTSGKEIVITFDADGAVRRGPDSINLTPGPDEILVETADTVSGSTGDIAGGPIGSAVGSAAGREWEKR